MKLLILALTFVFAMSSLAVPEGLETLRNTYRDQLAKISDEEMVAMATAQDQYIAALSALEKQFQAAGKLDPLLKTQEEKERFSRERIVSAEHISLDVREISNLQNMFIAATKNAPLGPAQKKLTLAGFYERSLKNLEQDLTKKNDIQGALAVKAEREGLAERPELVAAQAVVAKATKAAPKPAEPETPIVEDVPVVEEVKAATALSVTEKSRIEGAVKRRFNDFVDDVEDQDWDNALEFVEPDYVQKTGEHVAKSVLKMKYGMVARTTADNPRAKLRSKDIDVADSGDEASLVPEVWTGVKGHSLPKMTWVPVDGEWYISMGGNGGNQPHGGQLGQGDQWQRPDKRRRPHRR